MFCTECGQRLPDNAKFCSSCGKAQRDETAVPVAGARPAPAAASAAAPVTWPRPSQERVPPPAPATAERLPATSADEQRAGVVMDSPAPPASWSRGRRQAVVAAAIGAIVLVGVLVAYALQQRPQPAPIAASAPASQRPPGSTIWDHLSPAELTDAQRAFEQRLATEEREAMEHARPATSQ